MCLCSCTPCEGIHAQVTSQRSPPTQTSTSTLKESHLNLSFKAMLAAQHISMNHESHASAHKRKT